MNLATFEKSSYTPSLINTQLDILKATERAMKIKGDYIDNRHYFTDGRGVKEKLYNINFGILREISRKVVIVSAIINTRCSQIRPFSRPSLEDHEPGYKIRLIERHRKPTKQEQKEIEEITEFFKYCGYVNNGHEINEYPREDFLGDVNEKLSREYNTIDQVAIVPRFNMRGEVIEFRVIDGATIKRINPEMGFLGDKKVLYIQELNGEVVETFAHNELIFDYLNRRADINYAMYGYAPAEMALETITGFLFSQSYNLEQFNTNAQPKGFFSFDSEKPIPPQQLEELQRNWVAMFSGVKGLWRTPFLQFNAKWNSLGNSNRDMEFNEYIQFIASLICGVYKIDPAEMGWDFNRSKSVLSENNEAKLKYSKSRGLNDNLFGIAKVYNKLLAIDPRWRGKYCFDHTGIDPIDRQGELNLANMAVKTYKTINEIRKENDMEELPDGDIIMDNTFMQYKMQYKMQKEAMSAGADGGQDMGIEEEPEESDGGDLDSDKMADDVFKDVFGKSAADNKKYVEFELSL